MLPLFPLFKKIELSDRDDIEKITSKFPPYSDFNFVSLWSWDIKGEMQVSLLNGNVAVKFSDYLTADLFYSFIGTNHILETIEELLKRSGREGLDMQLKYIAKDVIEQIQPKNFPYHVHEDVDNNDYIYSIDALVKYEGSAFKTQRNSLNSFLRKFPAYEARVLDLQNQSIQREILQLYKIWESNGSNIVPHEFAALRKCLETVQHLPVFGIGIFIENQLVGFNIDQVENREYAACLFAKGNIKFYGIYSALMNETAKILQRNYNVKYLNNEQDLGLFNLRKSKKAFHPVYFLKKYSVGRVLN